MYNVHVQALSVYLKFNTLYVHCTCTCTLYAPLFALLHTHTHTAHCTHTTGKPGTTRPDMPLPPVPSAGGRVDMPLPPIPSSSPTPPVPQRNTAGNTAHPPPAATPSSAPTPSQEGGALVNSYPPLPPRNPRANGGGTSPVPQQQNSPPEPARSPPTSTVSRGQGREDSIMDLVTLGYSRSAVVRALSIARNDFNIAKSILMEFGGGSGP